MINKYLFITGSFYTASIIYICLDISSNNIMIFCWFASIGLFIGLNSNIEKIKLLEAPKTFKDNMQFNLNLINIVLVCLASFVLVNVFYNDKLELIHILLSLVFISVFISNKIYFNKIIKKFNKH